MAGAACRSRRGHGRQAVRCRTCAAQDVDRPACWYTWLSISLFDCWRRVQGRVLPPLAGILGAPDGQPDMLVEGALDLLAALLRPSRPEARHAHANTMLSACPFLSMHKCTSVE